MRLTSGVLLLAAIGFLAADEPKKDDAEAFKGNWTALSIKSGEQETPADVVKRLKFTFDGKAYTNILGDEVVEEGGYTIDASKTPKTIDFDIKKGDDAGKKQLGIYKIEENKLTLVVAQPGSTERPKSLQPAPSDNMIEAVLERAKP
jgi:uncharacterized protein (TIGR03067 family)